MPPSVRRRSSKPQAGARLHTMTLTMASRRTAVHGQATRALSTAVWGLALQQTQRVSAAFPPRRRGDCLLDILHYRQSPLHRPCRLHIIHHLRLIHYPRRPHHRPCLHTTAVGPSDWIQMLSTTPSRPMLARASSRVQQTILTGTAASLRNAPRWPSALTGVLRARFATRSRISMVEVAGMLATSSGLKKTSSFMKTTQTATWIGPRM